MKLIAINKKDWPLIKRAFNYVKPNKFKFAFSFFLLLVGISFNLILPYLWAKIIACIFNKDYNTLIFIVISITIVLIIQSIYGLLQNYVSTSLYQEIVYNVKKDMYKKILDLPMKAFDQLRAGDFISRLQGDANTISQVITGQFLNSVVDVLKIITFGIAVFCINLPMAIMLLITFPLSLIVFIKFGKLMREKNKEMAEMNDNYFSNVHQSITGIREIKGLGIKNQNYLTFISLLKLMKEKVININIFGGISQLITQTFNYISEIGVIIVGAYQIYKGFLKIEFFITFTSYSIQFSESIMNISNLNNNIQQAMTSLERIFGIMDNLNYQEYNYGNLNLKNIEGNIKFDGITFGYNENSNILNNVSFEIQKNKKIAIIGKSGSGKSTIFNLIQNFYKPQLGKILIDDIELNKLSEDCLREHISIVRQEPFLFNLSIKDNLLLVNPTAKDDDVINACKLAFIHEYISNLPEGYNTLVQDGGANFSVGQKQRIAIARVLLKNTKIILFDEATSSLDNESQYYIKKAIDNLSLNHTVIIIAHRLLTFIESDEIILLDKGIIAGIGNHSTLIKNNEIYNLLYHMELDTYNKSQNLSLLKDVNTF